MDYSNTTTKNGIIQREEVLCHLGDTGISGNTTLLRQFVGYNNQAYSEVVMAIKSVDLRNTWDDFNYTNYPDAPITMVVSTNNYTIPVAATGQSVNTNIGIKGVYLRESSGERTYLSLMEHTDTLSQTDGVPVAYKVIGKSIFFNCPLSAATLTKYSSLFYVEFQRSPDYFTYDDTTQEPGFMVTYHDLIPIRGSALYLKPTKPDLATLYDQEFYVRLEMLKRDTALFIDAPRRLTPSVESCE